MVWLPGDDQDDFHEYTEKTRKKERKGGTRHQTTLVALSPYAMKYQLECHAALHYRQDALAPIRSSFSALKAHP